jgi:hypothetical protein
MDRESSLPYSTNTGLTQIYCTEYYWHSFWLKSNEFHSYRYSIQLMFNCTSVFHRVLLGHWSQEGWTRSYDERNKEFMKNFSAETFRKTFAWKTTKKKEVGGQVVAETGNARTGAQLSKHKSWLANLQAEIRNQASRIRSKLSISLKCYVHIPGKSEEKWEGLIT